jgi:transmembrane sensor
MSWAHTETHPLAEEAAQWLIELEEPGPQALQAFATWLERSPRHVEEFLLAAAVWKEFDDFDVDRRMEIRQLIDAARSNVRQLHPEAASGRDDGRLERPPSRYRMLAVVSAIAASVLAGIALWLFGTGTPDVYATSRGEQRAFKLDDGSVVYLNTQSRVEVRFSDAARDIRLLEGEAMFTVEHDAARPFRVTADHTVIQAVGTRFNVYRNVAGTTVSVVEGIVQISPMEDLAAQSRSLSTASDDGPTAAQQVAAGPARVAAGEQVRVSRDGEIVKRAVPDLANVVAWRERRLVFRGDTLEDVAREFNRYNTLQIRLEDDAVRGRRLTGVFDADDPRSLVLFLGRDATLAVEDGPQEVVIRQR